MATVVSCHYETRAGRALAFGLPSSKRFHITFNYWAGDELLTGDFYAAKAMPQGTLFPIALDSHQPHPQIRRTPRIGLLAVAGSIVLSLAWLAIVRGCY